MFNAPQPLTFSISPEVKDVLITASGSLNESIIDKFMISNNLLDDNYFKLSIGKKTHFKIVF